MADDAALLTLAGRRGRATIATESDGKKATPEAKLHGQCACIHQHRVLFHSPNSQALFFKDNLPALGPIFSFKLLTQKKSQSTLCFDIFNFLSSSSQSLFSLKPALLNDYGKIL